MGLSNNLGKLSNMITSTGSAVGIAQASPAYTLDVTGTLRNTGQLNTNNIIVTGTTGALFGGNAATTAAVYGYINNTTGRFYFGSESSTGGTITTGSTAYYGQIASQGLQFSANTGSNVHMTIGTTGNVGIGTSSPSEKLHLYNNTAGTPTTLIIENNVNNQNSQINFKSIYGGSTAKSFLIGSNISVAAGSWEIYDATAAAARLVITSGGSVGIGSSGYSDTRLNIQGAGATSATYAFSAIDSSATLLFAIRNDGVIFTGGASRSPYNDVSAAGANLIVVSGGNLQRSTSSLRFKTNVEDLYTDASSLIYKMRPIWYRSLGYTDRKDWSWYGFIAEEMAEIEPRLVQWGKDENDNDIADGIQYERISVLLVAEMQKMNKLVQELSAQNQDLKSRLDKAGL